MNEHVYQIFHDTLAIWHYLILIRILLVQEVP